VEEASAMGGLTGLDIVVLPTPSRVTGSGGCKQLGGVSVLQLFRRAKRPQAFMKMKPCA
jgi:hypothetical protein